MNNFESNQHSVLDIAYDEHLKSMLLKYNRASKITQMLIFGIIILLIASFFFSTNKYNQKFVPINYERLSENSIDGENYYIDSIVSCTEIFELVNTVNGKRLNTKAYYLAVDKNGFEFLIQANSHGRDYLKNSMMSGIEDLVLYGKLTTLSTDFEIFSDSTVEDIPEIANDYFSDKKEKIISYANQHKILEIYSKPPKTKSVDDEINLLYVIIITIRCSLVVSLIVLSVLKKYYTTKVMDIINYKEISNLA
ncbi:MAG: hypothetical protein IKA17_10280 [Clostridia bacterium]|nr:hypothetical protein [Clostridia bacterium]